MIDFLSAIQKHLSLNFSLRGGILKKKHKELLYVSQKKQTLSEGVSISSCHEEKDLRKIWANDVTEKHIHKKLVIVK